MGWRRAVCRVIGHHWLTYFEHAEFGTPRLVRCRRCGYVSSKEDERRRTMGRLGGSAPFDP
jgi:hypothetical protein